MFVYVSDVSVRYICLCASEYMTLYLNIPVRWRNYERVFLTQLFRGTDLNGYKVCILVNIVPMNIIKDYAFGKGVFKLDLKSGL